MSILFFWQQRNYLFKVRPSAYGHMIYQMNFINWINSCL
jgi:hypothetical protein